MRDPGTRSIMLRRLFTIVVEDPESLGFRVRDRGFQQEHLKRNEKQSRRKGQDGRNANIFVKR